MSGYDNFFKTAKNAKKPNGVASQSKPLQSKQTAEEYLREALKVKETSIRRSRSNVPYKALILTVAGAILAGAGLIYPKEVESLYNRLEIAAFSMADAANTPEVEAQNSQSNKPSAAESTATSPSASAENCVAAKGFSEEELSHFNKLNERKSELDRRDTELTALEEELHKQKKEVEARIVKLEQIRDEVANVLKDKVEVDQQRVSTLVDFYSNMKPKQAAEILATLNEDLAVEVIGKMKKKNAADIMNLLAPAKARALSEKFTGYKRR